VSPAPAERCERALGTTVAEVPAVQWLRGGHTERTDMKVSERRCRRVQPIWPIWSRPCQPLCVRAPCGRRPDFALEAGILEVAGISSPILVCDGGYRLCPLHGMPRVWLDSGRDAAIGDNMLGPSRIDRR